MGIPTGTPVIAGVSVIVTFIFVCSRVNNTKSRGSFSYGFEIQELSMKVVDTPEDDEGQELK